MSTKAWNKRAGIISDSEIELWRPLWRLLQDSFDEALGGESVPEDGDPGSLHAHFEAIAKDAGVSLFYTLRAALYRFSAEHSEKFINGVHNLKYRVPTPEEAAVLREVIVEHPELSHKPEWLPEDDPSFQEKFRQRMNDAISGLDAGIQ